MANTAGKIPAQTPPNTTVILHEKQGKHEMTCYSSSQRGQEALSASVSGKLFLNQKFICIQLGPHLHLVLMSNLVILIWLELDLNMHVS